MRPLSQAAMPLRWALVAAVVLGQCTTEAFLPSAEYAATLHLTDASCTAASATWAGEATAACAAPDCSFTAGDASSCAPGCTYAAVVPESCAVAVHPRIGEARVQTTCALVPACEATDAAACERQVLDGKAGTCTDAGDCAYTAATPGVAEQCKATQLAVCAAVDIGADATCAGVSGCAVANVCTVSAGFGSCARTKPSVEMCYATYVTAPEGAGATAACADDWRPAGCEGPRADCEEAWTGNEWDMYRVRHVACSGRQGGRCAIKGMPCTAANGLTVDSCVATDEAACAAVVPADCSFTAGDASSCGAGCAYDSGADTCASDGSMATACGNAGACSYTAPNAANGVAESCAATAHDACAAVTADGTVELAVHDTAYATAADVTKADVSATSYDVQADCAAATGCTYTPSDFFIAAASEADCEVMAAGGVWTDVVPASCSRADGTSIDDPPDSDEHCAAEKAACRSTASCNTVLGEITTASGAGTSVADLVTTYTDGTDRGVEFAALVECMTPYTVTKTKFDYHGGACKWPGSEAAGFVQATLDLIGTTIQQTIIVPEYVDSTQCRWSISCPGTEKEPVVNVTADTHMPHHTIPNNASTIPTAG